MVIARGMRPTLNVSSTSFWNPSFSSRMATGNKPPYAVRLLPSKSYGVEAPSLLGSGITRSPPCGARLSSLCSLLRLTIWVTPGSQLAKLSTSRPFCSSTGFPGSPSGSFFQYPPINSQAVHRSGVTKQPERWVTATAGIYLARGKQVEVRVTPTCAAITESVELAHEFSNRVLRRVRREFPRGWDVRERPQVRTLCRRVVVQALPEPSLDFCHAHPLAFAIVGNLVAVDLTETEIARFRMGEVEPTHARAGPHRKGLRDQHSGVGLHIEQSPKGALFRVIRARRVTRSRPDPPVLLCDEIRVAQALCTTVAPFIPHPLV